MSGRDVPDLFSSGSQTFCGACAPHPSCRFPTDLEFSDVDKGHAFPSLQSTEVAA
jgi:hypothetical protein